MPIDAIPKSAAVVAQRTKIDVQRELGGANPFLGMSWLGGMITALSNRIFEFYHSLEQHSLELIPDTAVTFLGRWAAIWGVTRLPATRATGKIAINVTAGNNVPISTIFKVSSKSYITLGTVSAVVNPDLGVASITRSATTATVTTDEDHGLASNVLVTIENANQVEYNLANVVITVTGNKTFTYTVTGSPADPATGSITWTATWATAEVDSQSFGVLENQTADTILTIDSPLAGVTDAAWVIFQYPIDGGVDQELDVALRTRFLERIQNPVALFNVAAIETQCKLIAGVTRVFVKEITPLAGQVTIYFMRDNDTVTAIPSATEITTVKNKLLEIKPAQISDADVIVSAPGEVSQVFTFSALSPDTVAMQAAILENLQQFFAEVPTVGVNVDEDIYRAIITGSIDTTNGDTVLSFALSAPGGDIVVTSSEIATLGTVTPVP